MADLPGVPRETSVALAASLSALSSRLDKLEGRPVSRQAQASSFFASAGEAFTVDAPAAGLSCALPSPRSVARNATVSLLLRTTNPTRISCVDGTINGVAQLSITTVGLFMCQCDGSNGWSVSVGSGGSSPGGGTDPRIFAWWGV